MSTLRLSAPFEISPSLQPALRVGQAWVCLERSSRPGREGRDRFQWTILLPDGSEHSGEDLQSGCNGASLQGMFGTLCSFLSACGESWNYCARNGERGENADLFPAPVAEWASGETDTLVMLSVEIEESDSVMIEEGSVQS